MRRLLVVFLLLGCVAALCGDGTCESNETCRTCAEDCSCVSCGSMPPSFSLEIGNPETVDKSEEHYNRYETSFYINCTLREKSNLTFNVINPNGWANLDWPHDIRYGGGGSGNTGNLNFIAFTHVEPQEFSVPVMMEMYESFGIRHVNVTVAEIQNLENRTFVPGRSVECDIKLYGPLCDCDFDEECDDGKECTADFCDNCRCVHPKKECGTPCSSGFCENGVCTPLKSRGASCRCEICKEGLFCHNGRCTRIPECGNGLCDLEECENCPQDCEVEDCAGNRECDTQVGEICNNTDDCRCGSGQRCDPDHPSADAKGCFTPFCGDGLCLGKEDCLSCPKDCGCPPGQECVNGVCRGAVECNTDRHCEDEKPCTEDRCVDGRCVREEIVGCPLENECYPIGTRQVVDGQTAYCAYDESWWTTKGEGANCQMDFECKGSDCNFGKCGPVKLFDIIRVLRFLVVEWGIEPERILGGLFS